MLKANAIFNIFAGVFDVRNCVFRVLNYVRQNIAVVFDALAFDSLCFDYVLANTLSCSRVVKGGPGSRFTKNKMAISLFTGNKMAISR